MDIKLFLSVIATVIAVISYVPYIRDIWKGKTKPHAFSWLVWAIITYIAGFAQLAGGGGIGSLVAFSTATISLGIAVYSYWKGTINITASDWVSLGVALLAIPLWLVTDSPLLAVILVVGIDIAAFWPTIRKSYHQPHSENISTYALSTVKHCLTVAAQQQYNLLTVLFPLWLAIITAAFVAMLWIRRVKITEKVVV